MSAQLHRWSVAAAALAALLLTAVPAAASPATSGSALPAQFVTSSTALLRATIDTAGQRTSWTFEYGTNAGDISTTRPRMLPANAGRVDVALRIGDLRPRTRYHFRILTQYGQGTVTYPIFVTAGVERTFVTRVRGDFGLGSPTVILSGAYAPVPLYCASRARCTGSLTLTRPRPGHPRHPFILGHRRIVLGGHVTHSFPVRLSATALRRLTRPYDLLTTTLTVTPTSRRARLTHQLTLVR